MAALAGITAVRPTRDTQVRNMEYGATVGIGQLLHFDTADNSCKLGDSNLSELAATLFGLAMTPGVDGSYGLVAVGGEVVLVGATMAVGETYYLGATAGEIVPDADLAAGHRIAKLGIAVSTTLLRLQIDNTGIIHP
jgi:hypothetical protein